MKRTLLLLMLVVTSITGNLCAQEFQNYYGTPTSQTEFFFEARGIHNRHIVRLEKGEEMIIELFDLNDYEILGNIDSILKAVREDLINYKDSMRTAPSGNMSIDFVHMQGADNNKIRIRKYNQHGDIFINKSGKVSRLKIEQDTLKILIGKLQRDVRYKQYVPVKITFILNNYGNIEDLIANTTTLQRYIDTMYAVSKPKSDKYSPYDRTSIIYNPLNKSATNFMFLKGVLLKNFNPYWMFKPGLGKIGINVYLGAGLLRNQLSPTADIGIELRLPWDMGSQNILSIYTSPYFTFANKPDGSYNTYTNWFVNLEFGRSTLSNWRKQEEKAQDLNFLRGTLGIGYLTNPDGRMFQNTTMKFFVNYTFKNCISLSPEIICTDNFQNVFPGITMKYFLNAFLDD